MDQHAGLQIVATSHSPYLIDELNDDEVWVLNLRDDGTAAAACLADHPDAERFRGESHQLGQGRCRCGWY